MTAPIEIRELVQRFQQNIQDYTDQRYNETQVRVDFINPFFAALGWDIDNTRGAMESYRDVIHEDRVKVGNALKAPDYSFWVEGVRKFFVEAKKPGVNLKTDTKPAFQLRSYGWSAGMPLSILTNFEEFVVYDCRIEPKEKEDTRNAQLLYIPFTEYEARWDEITALFSRDAVRAGALEKYAEAKKALRGSVTVDRAFLKLIERWRDMLADDIAQWDKSLTPSDLNFAVQMTIDRIVFLRICEDRGIEQYGRLLAIINGGGTYARLCDLFKEADSRYNSGLFHFNEERGRSNPDTLTLRLQIGNEVLQGIIRQMYPPTPYAFDVIPIEILGNVYEQFLGKVIQVSKPQGEINGAQTKMSFAERRIEIVEKPEVRKAGGVYYTPSYIVDYIVKNTVGKLLDGKTPDEAAKLRVLDPACGSGSFLIGAYQYLLDWHRDWYVNNNPQQHKAQVIQIKEMWRLTTEERKHILTNNIYGVDIDEQAVETTKLSLLLRVLEGETNETLTAYQHHSRKRALPDLDKNIKCGNSLIGSDFYSDKRMSDIDEDMQRRINIFDWKTEFAPIMDAGGFDAVIGNPPYVDIKGLPEIEVDYIFSKYATANNRINLFATFIEQALKLVTPRNFRLSMIIPTAFLTQDSYRSLRYKILNEYTVSNIVRLPNESFGESAGKVKVDTAIFVLESKNHLNVPVDAIAYTGYTRITNIRPEFASIHIHIDQSNWLKSDNYVWYISATNADIEILHKCELQTIPLEQCAEFSLGITPYDKYKGHKPDQISQKVFHADFAKDETFKKLLAGNDVMRYRLNWNGKQWISYGIWLGAPREQRFFVQRHILVKQIIDWTTKRIWATITDEELYNTQNAFNLLARQGWNLNYLLALLNSRLMNFYHRKKFLDDFKMRFQKILIKDSKKFPIHTINFDNPIEKGKHDKIVELVEQMLDLHKQKERAVVSTRKIQIERQIEATDNQIDALVYELYGLTEAEIKIVEGK